MTDPDLPAHPTHPSSPADARPDDRKAGNQERRDRAAVPDVVCVSYLADTTILMVDAYPASDHGAVVHRTESSLAGDGPLMALTASRLGLRTAVIANDVGLDPAGRRLLTHLDQHGIHHTIRLRHGARTPTLTVINDNAGTRTWFAHLEPAMAALDAVDLTPLAHARLGYIDCYQATEHHALAALAASGATPLMLNLGGDALTDPLAAATAGRRIAVVQTNLSEDDAAHAPDLAFGLHRRLRADAAVVTLGRLGAVVHAGDGSHRVPAATVEVGHTHGAGAAFSAGYASALLAGADPVAATAAGCDTATAHCVRGNPTTPANARPAQADTAGSV